MNRVLLVSAASLAAAFVATPASAEHWSDRGFPAVASVNVHRGGGAFHRREVPPPRPRPPRSPRSRPPARPPRLRPRRFLRPLGLFLRLRRQPQLRPRQVERLVARTAVAGLSALGAEQPRLRARTDVAGRRSVALQLVSRRSYFLSGRSARVFLPHMTLTLSTPALSGTVALTSHVLSLAPMPVSLTGMVSHRLAAVPEISASPSEAL